MATARERSAMKKMSPGRRRAFRALIASRKKKATKRTATKRAATKRRATKRATKRTARKAGTGITVRVVTSNGGKKKMPAALIANPRRRRRRRKASTTTRRRRSPTRRRRRSTAPRKTRRVRKAGSIRVRPRRGGRRVYKTLYTNGRRRRLRRNPSSIMKTNTVMGALKSAFVPYAAGFATSMVASVLDSALINMPAVKALSKVALSVGAVMAFGRKHPTAAAGAVGALAASTGYEIGVRLAGGIQLFPNDENAADKAANSDVGALLSGMGILTGMEPVPQAIDAYEGALNGYGDY